MSLLVRLCAQVNIWSAFLVHTRMHAWIITVVTTRVIISSDPRYGEASQMVEQDWI